ncbi:MAG: MarR family winged helix-turn-helix transcriptional regulator [Polyangiaceae bacterium]|jgi:DNA-binding MarR family transcriptional regulator
MAFRSARKPDAAPTIADAHAAIACLTRLTELTQQRRVQLATAVGLTDQQWGVLEEIATEHFMPSLFARRRDSSAAAVSKILRQLSDKGLVVAEIAAGDGRQRHYSLSAEGRRVMDRLRASREAAIRDIWLALDAARLRAFTQVGQSIIEGLERYAATVISKQE